MELLPEYDYESRGQTCSVCHAARRPTDQIIRLGPPGYIDMEGFFDICSTCITQMGAMVGLYTEDKVAKMSQELLQLRAQNETLQKRIEEGRKVLA